MTTAELLALLDQTFAVVNGTARSTVRHLHTWTAGFPATTSGAPPSAAASVTVDSTEPGADAATRKLRRIFALVDELVVYLDDDTLPPPARRLESQLAYVTWHINRLTAAPHPGQIKHALRLVIELEALVTTNQPPVTDTNGVPAGGCVAHARAGQWASIDARYTRHELCRRCGEFRHLHRQLPPPRLVLFAEKHGWRNATTPANLDRFGVRRSLTSATRSAKSSEIR